MKQSLLETTENTRWAVPDKYIRSDHLRGITEKDIKWLKDNNVKLIVDLRSKREICYANRTDPTGTIDRLRKDFIWINAPVSEYTKKHRGADDWIHGYSCMVTCDLLATIRLIQKYAEKGFKVLYNCHAGKDRTGVVSAILQLEEGYKLEEVIDNYLLTEQYRTIREERHKPNKLYILSAIHSYMNLNKELEIEKSLDGGYMLHIMIELLEITGETFNNLRDIVDIEFWAATHCDITAKELAEIYHLPVKPKQERTLTAQTDIEQMEDYIYNVISTIDYLEH